MDASPAAEIGLASAKSGWENLGSLIKNQACKDVQKGDTHD